MGLRRFVTAHAAAACHEVEKILVYPPAPQALHACYADGCKGLAPPVLFGAKLYEPKGMSLYLAGNKRVVRSAK